METIATARTLRRDRQRPRTNGCHVYAVSLEKAKANDALDEAKFFPLAFQRLIAKFYAEVVNTADTGTIVCDWSNYQMDHHITSCVGSMVIANSIDLLRGGVTYGSSTALPTLQVADLISGCLRRSLEGQTHIDELAERFRSLRYVRPGEIDVLGIPSTVSYVYSESGLRRCPTIGP